MEFLLWLETTPIANAIRSSVWLYPAIESMHYIGLAMLVGGIMLIDLRVLGFARSLPLKSMIGLLPWVWAGFIVNVTTGSLLFIYGASNFATSGAFQLKMVLMVLAGINAFAFELITRKDGGEWIRAEQPPVGAKVFATLSLVLWMSVVTTGRWMAYI